jgi:PAS domain S-box-containing protein
MAVREKSTRRVSPVSNGTVKARTTSRDRLAQELESQHAMLASKLQKLKKIHSELETARDNFAALYDRSPIGYITFDRRGRIHNVNATAAALFGLERVQLLNRSFATLVHRDDARLLSTHLSRCETPEDSKGTTEVRVITELRLQVRKPRRPTGATHILPTQLISVPFGSAEGQKLFLAAVVDLTDHVRNEHALAEAKAFAESIVDTVSQPLAVLDSDLKIISANRAFVQFFEKPAEHHVRGRSFEVLLDLWWSGNKLRSELEKVLLENQSLENFQLEIAPPGLGKRLVLLNARRLDQNETSPPRVLVALEDITARHHAEENLRKLNEELEKRVEVRARELRKSYEQMESFCYSIAHDLRAPLRGMMGFGHLLAERFGEQIGNEGQEYTDRIQQSAMRMDRLIQDLLSYGRLNTIHLPIGEVNLEQTYHDVVAQCDKDIQDTGARIVKNDTLPGVNGHRVVLEVALTNLFSNAIKFVAPGVRPEVSVWPEDKGSHVRIWIQDNGIGIAPEDRKRIFGVFQRLHTLETYPGTGIGLALVSKGIERIGGRVGVESEPGTGSRFWIELQKAGPS